MTQAPSNTSTLIVEARSTTLLTRLSECATKFGIETDDDTLAAVVEVAAALVLPKSRLLITCTCVPPNILRQARAVDPCRTDNAV